MFFLILINAAGYKHSYKSNLISCKNTARINRSKCKAILFNPHRKYAVMPQLTLSRKGGEYLDVVENVQLLGVKLRSDMRWWDNTEFICKKGYSRLWILRRLKGLGANQDESSLQC